MYDNKVLVDISIHPPREGWDGGITNFKWLLNDFNPPTP